MQKFKSLIAVAALSAACGFIAPAFADDAAAPKLTDPQIAHIAYTAGDIDIKTAKLALKKTHNADVKAFAKDMVRDHSSVNKQALALCKKLGVTPEDNDTSKSLVKQADEERAKLAKLKGADFDKAYVENEVAYHHSVNSTLEDTLIPSASNQELKDFLNTGLKIFKGHEEHANHLASELK